MSRRDWVGMRRLSVLAAVALVILSTISLGIVAGACVLGMGLLVVIWGVASVRMSGGPLPGTYKVEHKVCGEMGVGDSVYPHIPGDVVLGFVAESMDRPDFEWVRVSRERP